MERVSLPVSAREAQIDDDAEEGLIRADGNNPAMRECMSCSRPFDSEGWHNRLCNKCRKLRE